MLKLSQYLIVTISNYSHRALLHGHGQVAEHVLPVGALAVRHPRVLDGHHRPHAALAAAAVVLILNCDLFLGNYLCENFPTRYQRNGSQYRVTMVVSDYLLTSIWMFHFVPIPFGKLRIGQKLQCIWARLYRVG